MAAEVVVQIVLENLISIVRAEVGLILGVDKEIEKLSSTLTTIQAVLEDAEDKQLESESIRNWLRKLNEVASKIDDVLDECTTEVSIMQHKNKGRSRYGLRRILYRHKIGRRIKEVVGELDDVAANRSKFHLRETDEERRESKIPAPQETISTVNEPNIVYGRDGEIDEIVDILVNQVTDCERLSVLPIVGIGGLGKTTLAQLVFNDPRVSEHFDTKLWVCVSDNFDLKILIKAMLEPGTECGSASDSTLESLHHRLRESLLQKRYLIILDNVWNEDQEKWAMLKTILACGSGGASIVVTTRLKMVADIVGTLPPHNLKGLLDEYCWSLFKQRAQFGEETEGYRKLEPIGRQIVKKCAGVPLAARTLGGLLRSKRTEAEWLDVQESEIWNLSPEKGLMPALRLSYRHLPLRLRKCFAYCAVFPKDSKIEKDDLIFLWMAHGCISSNGIMELEDVGNAVLNELVLRSLLEERTSTFSGMNNYFEMHDLIHDLAHSVLENRFPGEKGERSFRSSTNNKRIRHVHVGRRYVAFPSSIRNEADICYALMNFNRLRMLNASRMGIDELPSEIGELKHLRCLDLSHNNIRTLPNWVCRLWNLQILNLNFCAQLVELPEDMRNLKNLRHLLLQACFLLSKMPSNIGALSLLKTLSMFVVDPEKGNNMEELCHLNLGGKLKIRRIQRVKNHMDAKKANLIGKPNLRHLVLDWGPLVVGQGASDSRENLDKDVLIALMPHPNLEILGIDGFRGRSLPDCMRHLTDLETLELYECPELVELPEGMAFLQSLKHIGLYYLDSMVRLPEVMQHIPQLQTLELVNLPELSSLPDWLGNLTSLQKLKVTACPLLASLPASIQGMTNLKALSTSGCHPELVRRCQKENGEDWHKIAHIPDLTIG